MFAYTSQHYIHESFLLSFKMEPLIKESTTRLAEKISTAAEKGETVDAVQ